MPPTHTGTALPLDLSYNGVLKASLSRVATTHHAKLLLDALEADQKDARHVDTRLSSLKHLLPHWVGYLWTSLAHVTMCALWGGATCGSKKEKDARPSSQKLHKEGNLFRHVGKKGVPEDAPSDGEDEDQGEAEKDENEEEEGFSLLNIDDDKTDLAAFVVEKDDVEDETTDLFWSPPRAAPSGAASSSSSAAPVVEPPPPADRKAKLLKKLVGLRLAHKAPPGK